MSKKDPQKQLIYNEAIRQAAIIGIDACSQPKKALASLYKLFEAIGACKKDYEALSKKANENKVNPTTLERYGIPRSTINANPILREVVRYYQDKQEEEKVVITKRQFDDLKEELALYKSWHDEAVSKDAKYQALQVEYDDLLRKHEQLKNLYKSTKTLNVFNEILKEKPSAAS